MMKLTRCVMGLIGIVGGVVGRIANGYRWEIGWWSSVMHFTRSNMREIQWGDPRDCHRRWISALCHMNLCHCSHIVRTSEDRNGYTHQKQDCLRHTEPNQLVLFHFFWFIQWVSRLDEENIFKMKGLSSFYGFSMSKYVGAFYNTLLGRFLTTKPHMMGANWETLPLPNTF